MGKRRIMNEKKIIGSLLCGILGCFCLGVGDWLMIYGDTAYMGSISWLVIVSEVLMLPPYFYWFWVLVRGKSIFPRKMALSNPLVYYLLLKLVTMLMPDCAFRLAFTNGLMSESMLIWFAIMVLWSVLDPGRCVNGARIELSKT